MTWSYYPIAQFCIHPGQLHARFTRVQETVTGIEADAMTCAAGMPVHHFLQERINFPQRLDIVTDFNIGTPRLEVPKSTINGIILRLPAIIRKHIGEHSTIDKMGKRSENVTGASMTSGCQRQSW